MLGERPIRRLEIVVDDRGVTGTTSVAVDSSGREVRDVRFSLDWKTLKELEIEVGDRHAVTTRFLVAGVVGALSSKRKVFLVLGTADGEAFFELHSRHPERLRAQLSPWITQQQSTSNGHSAPSISDGHSTVGRLQELVDLHDRGMLQPDEFELLKSKLLSELS
jgi:hypothetical protein